MSRNQLGLVLLQWQQGVGFGPVIPLLKIIKYSPHPLCLVHKDAQECLLNLIGNISKIPSVRSNDIIEILCLLKLFSLTNILKFNRA